MSKQAMRRKISRLRSCLFDGKPMAIMPSALAGVLSAIDSQDFSRLKASLEFGREIESTTKVINNVAIIPVTGVLRDECDWMVRVGWASSYQLIERDLKKSMSDSQIKGVLFYFDTPGGSAIGCKRVADTINELRGEKPIRGYVQSMCGSAGYYMLSACDRAEATADSLVGSIGTIYPHVEFSDALKEMGIGATVFTNSDSPRKGDGHPYQPLSAAAKKTLQDFVDSYGRSFIADVARYRGLTPQNVIDNFGGGDAFRADIAIKRGMVDAIVANFQESLESISGASSESPVEETQSDETPVVTGLFSKEFDMKVSKKIRAQLFALGLINDADCSDEICIAAINAWMAARGVSDVNATSDEKSILAAFQSPPKASAKPKGETTEDEDDEEDPAMDDKSNKSKPANKAPKVPADNVKNAHEAEMGEARLADLRAAADLVNQTAGYVGVTADMVLDAFEKKLDAKGAMVAWGKVMAEKEKTLPANRVRVTGEGADQFAKDVVDALVYRASNNRDMQLSDNASALTNRPLWAVAGECLRLAGQEVDMYGSREIIAEQAMEMVGTRRHTFYSSREDRKYIQASAGPSSRPGDFPNILSSLMNKFLDTIELDNDFSYPLVSAVLPGGLNDFKPAMMINKGIAEELDVLNDAGQFNEIGINEEVLSYIFLQRFGNKWGWTPVMIANDDMNAFAEGMLGLAEAWEVTQNRLVVDRFTSSETLLDGSALFANRADTGAGTNPALNNNIAGTGGAPSDTTWASCETAYADIGGINTGRRVRGALNVWFGPTGTQYQEARRTFMPLNVAGIEPKAANTTANTGIYRGLVQLIPESELRVASTVIWYCLRSPTSLNTATVVRGYFNGFGQAGRRERWYDPENKTTWVSIEGRIAVATKNWRYAVRNAGQ